MSQEDGWPSLGISLQSESSQSSQSSLNFNKPAESADNEGREIEFTEKNPTSRLATPSSQGQTMRSVSLRKMLNQPWRFWFANRHTRSHPAKEKIFRASVPTTRFDIFISHEWKTRGLWKFLSLLIHFCWPTMLVSWPSGAVLAFALCMCDALPRLTTLQIYALDFGGVVPSGCWVQIWGLLGILSGCILFP